MACFSIWDIGGCGCGYGCAACVTCGVGVNMPCTFYVTDANGTWTLPYDPVNHWWAPTGALYAASQSGCAACSGGTNSCTGAPTTGQPFYGYVLTCKALHSMQLTRYFYYMTCGANHYYSIGGCTLSGSETTYAAIATVTCPSLTWSGTLSLVSGLLADPVGGTTSFSP